MSAKDGSVKVVVTAVVVNFFVTLSKSIGWLMSPSPSMLAEAIHSFADTANQLNVKCENLSILFYYDQDLMLMLEKKLY